MRNACWLWLALNAQRDGAVPVAERLPWLLLAGSEEQANKSSRQLHRHLLGINMQNMQQNAPKRLPQPSGPAGVAALTGKATKTITGVFNGRTNRSVHKKAQMPVKDILGGSAAAATAATASGPAAPGAAAKKAAIASGPSN